MYSFECCLRYVPSRINNKQVYSALVSLGLFTLLAPSLFHLVVHLPSIFKSLTPSWWPSTAAAHERYYSANMSAVNQIFAARSSSNHRSNNCSGIIRTKWQASSISETEVYPKMIELFRNESIDFECLNTRRPKRILLWNNLFRRKDLRDHETKFRCPVRQCQVTENRHDLRQTDLILVNLNDDHHIDDLSSLTKSSPSSQILAYMVYKPLDRSLDLSINILVLYSKFRIQYKN